MHVRGQKQGKEHVAKSSVNKFVFRVLSYTNRQVANPSARYMMFDRPPATDDDERPRPPAARGPHVAGLRDDVDEREHLQQTPHTLVH